MHEYSLMKNIIEDILKQLKETPLSPTESVKTIHLKVGALDIHSEESFRQAFEILVKETMLERCDLQLTIEPGSLKCKHCSYQGPCSVDDVDGHDPTPITECPQCGAINPVIGGRGIQTIDLLADESLNSSQQ